MASRRGRISFRHRKSRGPLTLTAVRVPNPAAIPAKALYVEGAITGFVQIILDNDMWLRFCYECEDTFGSYGANALYCQKCWREIVRPRERAQQGKK